MMTYIRPDLEIRYLRVSSHLQTPLSASFRGFSYIAISNGSLIATCRLDPSDTKHCPGGD